MKVWLEKDSLQRLVDISEHPRYGKFVMHLTISTHRLNPYKYNEEPASGSDNLIRLHSEKEAVARAGGLVDYLEYQKKLEREGLDIVLLSTAMRKFPKLSTIIFDSSSSKPVSTQFITDGFALDDPGPEWRRHVLQVGLQALVRAECQPRTILIDRISDEGYFTPYWAFQDISLLIPKAGLRSLVHNLKTFYFDGVGEDDSLDEFVLHGVALGRFLEHASQLEELYLDIQGVWGEENSLSALTGQGQRRRLRKLTLAHYGTSMKELVTWLLLHSSSLETISFRCLWLVKGRWDEFMDLLRASPWPLLSFIDLRGVFALASDGDREYLDWDHGSAQLVDYVQRDTDANPYHVSYPERAPR
ncbi:hypothetical protein G7Y79_00017g042550 [Physcia stellaris]|nr:hypothetical protein G7Y79_00017g042550 [Physcia stellaris]